MHLEGFTVNLADIEGNRFLRVTMYLAIDRLPPPSIRDKPFSGLPMARMRDSILSVLTVCKSDALLTAEGKEQSRARSAQIYFTEFLVQRFSGEAVCRSGARARGAAPSESTCARCDGAGGSPRSTGCHTRFAAQGERSS